MCNTIKTYVLLIGTHIMNSLIRSEMCFARHKSTGNKRQQLRRHATQIFFIISPSSSIEQRVNVFTQWNKSSVYKASVASFFLPRGERHIIPPRISHGVAVKLRKYPLFSSTVISRVILQPLFKHIHLGTFPCREWSVKAFTASSARVVSAASYPAEDIAPQISHQHLDMSHWWAIWPKKEQKQARLSLFNSYEPRVRCS